MRRIILLLLSGGAILAAQQLTPEEFRQIGKVCVPDSDRRVVTAIVKTESAFRPLALSLNYPAALAKRYNLPPGRVFLKTQPRSRDEALRWIEELQDQGDTVSVGLMQVSLEGNRFRADAMLSPCENLRIGWQIFLEKYEVARKKTVDPAAAFRRAVSAYNTGSPFAGVRNGYVGSVLLNATNP